MDTHADTRDTHRKAARRYNRHTLTIHLIPGKDDDLIQMLNAVPDGKRQVVFKKLLRGQRAALEDVAPVATALTDPALREQVAWLMNAMNDLPGYLESIIQRVAAARPSADVLPGETASSETLNKRASRLKASQW